MENLLKYGNEASRFEEALPPRNGSFLKALKSVTPIKQNAIINVEGADTEIALEAGEEYIFA